MCEDTFSSVSAHRTLYNSTYFCTACKKDLSESLSHLEQKSLSQNPHNFDDRKSAMNNIWSDNSFCDEISTSSSDFSLHFTFDVSGDNCHIIETSPPSVGKTGRIEKWGNRLKRQSTTGAFHNIVSLTNEDCSEESESSSLSVSSWFRTTVNK